MLNYYALIFLLLCSIQASAQTLRGKVTDQQSGQPLTGAFILLTHAGDEQGTTTDSLGRFRVEGLEPGRYQTRISHLGFSVWHANELLIQRGKETILNIGLQPLFSPLQEVEVRTEAGISRLSALGEHGFSTEQTQRFAAAYYDPARLANAFPGVVTTDDQANNLSIRGNSPAGLLWRLEGVNVVNPNHLTNAGTFTDRAAPTGGGVNILSAQLLSDSRLLTGNFAPGYGNTTAGVMDMRLRKGNSQKREHTLQAGLLGIDLATEGPITAEKGSSYLANYRYSTVGLLSAAGVNFGNEEISYHDLSFHLSLPAAGAGDFTVFGLGGTNRTVFTSPHQAEWKTEKDRHNTDYRSRMMAAGATHNLRFAGRLRLESAVAFSHLYNRRNDELNYPNWSPIPPFIGERHTEELLSWRTGLHIPLHERFQLQAGVVTDIKQTGKRRITGISLVYDKQLSYTLWQPYLNANWQPHRKLALQLGLQHQYATYFNIHEVQPQVSVRFQAAPNHYLTFSAGRYSQLPPSALLLIHSFAYPAIARGFGFMRSDQLALGYTGRLAENWRLKAEIYHQQLSRVLAGSDSGSTFSVVNYLNEEVPERLSSTCRGRNYGLEVSVEKPLANQYYLLLSGTVFQALYITPDGKERSSRFNARYAAAVTTGKEWHWQNKAGRFREAGVHLRTTYRGGLRDLPIDLEASQFWHQHVYDQTQGYSVQLPNYFRLDVRLSLRTNRTRSTRLWYLDVQNATAYQNVAYRFYDGYQGKIVTRYQLGIIPVLGYRVEF